MREIVLISLKTNTHFCYIEDTGLENVWLGLPLLLASICALFFAQTLSSLWGDKKGSLTFCMTPQNTSSMDLE